MKRGQMYIGKPRLNTYQFEQKQKKILRNSKAKGKTLEKQKKAIDKKIELHSAKWEARKEYTNLRYKLKTSKRQKTKETYQELLNFSILDNKETLYDLKKQLYSKRKSFKRADIYIIREFITDKHLLDIDAEYLYNLIDKAIPTSYILIVLSLQIEEHIQYLTISIPNFQKNKKDYIKEYFNDMMELMMAKYKAITDASIVTNISIEYTPPNDERQKTFERYKNAQDRKKS